MIQHCEVVKLAYCWWYESSPGSFIKIIYCLVYIYVNSHRCFEYWVDKSPAIYVLAENKHVFWAYFTFSVCEYSQGVEVR